MSAKDDKNLAAVLDKITGFDEPNRTVMQRMHDVIVAAAPDLKPRIWYGMPGYAVSASTPVLVFIRNDDGVITLGVSEKAARIPAGPTDGLLAPSAWYVDDLDAATEQRIADVVKAATA